MLRMLDVFFALLGILTLSPLFLIILVLGLFDTGAPVFSQARVGRDRRIFRLYKFRTMKQSAENLPTHMVDPSLVTALGKFLRRTKVDELPQLWNVLIGQMSLVGPRPCLPTQKELIEERERRGVSTLRPGITGISQIRGLDMSDPIVLAESDSEMLRKNGLSLYLRCIVLTMVGSGAGDNLRSSKKR